MACMRDGFESGRPLDHGRFTTVSPLNHGSFGMVLAAKDTLTGLDVAIKCITKPGAASSINCPAAIATDDQSEELDIHSRLAPHGNIVNLIHNFETDNHQYMVLELCNNGDLYEAIRVGKGPLKTEHVRDFMLELVDSVDYLHCNGVFHRDIKPENIFLTSNGSMKLGDFGLATTETWSTEFAVGSDRYMAPEQYDVSNYGYGYSPAAADVWAIGIVLLNVLFQRNPFATPTMKDPLFADFVHDRQSLFDIFPNMSQDTYNILAHSMTLDPANRSLAAVREAIKDVVSFTIDDESLDDFCNEPTPLVPVVTAARQPLRTPSITSPNTSSADSFPWNSALLKTPQKATRQLSTIADEEMDLDMFPESVPSTRRYDDPDEASLSSNRDSGLGLSYKSTTSGLSIPSAVPIQSKSSFVGSLPISFSRPTAKASPYTANAFSKSWSDLWDEEEEMQQENLGMSIDRLGTAKPSTPRPEVIREDGRGSVTPRQGLVAIDVNVASGSTRPSSRAESKAADTPKTSLLDKWSALGNFRRAKPDHSPAPAAAATPPKTKYSEAFASFTPFSSSKKPKTQPIKTPQPAASWRQGSPQRLRATSTNKSQVWQEDNNWRQHRSPAVAMKTPSPPLMTVRRSPSLPQHLNALQVEKPFLDINDFQDDDDFEWAAGALLHL